MDGQIWCRSPDDIVKAKQQIERASEEGVRVDRRSPDAPPPSPPKKHNRRTRSGRRQSRLLYFPSRIESQRAKPIELFSLLLPSSFPLVCIAPKPTCVPFHCDGRAGRPRLHSIAEVPIYPPDEARRPPRPICLFLSGRNRRTDGRREGENKIFSSFLSPAARVWHPPPRRVPVNPTLIENSVGQAEECNPRLRTLHPTPRIRSKKLPS